jgi:hypothetical protein
MLQAVCRKCGLDRIPEMARVSFDGVIVDQHAASDLADVNRNDTVDLT